MIRIKKPEKIPQILETKGAEKCAEMCSTQDTGKHDFDKRIYGHRDVKRTLCEIQNDKCVFCETQFTHDSPGDVEHFRPKSIYYWLAYDWKNLFLACEECNRSHKKDKFPLLNENERAITHLNDVAREQPLFIHPANENPEEFISFRGEVIFPLNANQRGKATIEGVGLNRIKLESDRKNYLKNLKFIYDLAHNSPPTPLREEALAHLEHCASEKGEYSAMVKAALRDKFAF